LEFVGLAEVEPGVQENYRHGAVDPADQVRQDHPATAEAHREGNLGGEGLYRPGERRGGIRPGQHGGALAYLEGAKHPSRSLSSPVELIVSLLRPLTSVVMLGTQTKRARFPEEAGPRSSRRVPAIRQSQRHNRVRSPRSEHTSRNRADNSAGRCGVRSWFGIYPASLAVSTTRSGS